ncbi:MAG TPA: N-acetylmuramoyl-L-alanine amidase [Ignavibacteriales bacterium]|nr:N-acetylmuramoyl-L-alanine amidase [Ignavibacteriales bacterium]
MKKRYLLSLFLLLSFMFTACSSRIEKEEGKETKKEVKPAPVTKTITENIKDFLSEVRKTSTPLQLPSGVRIDTVMDYSPGKRITVVFNRAMQEIPFRSGSLKTFEDAVKASAGADYKDYSFTFKTGRYTLEELIPNFYRDKSQYDPARLAKNTLRPMPVVGNTSRPYTIETGLNDRNIVLWHSHGWYYNNTLDRWEWQRPRLFESVEDKVPLSFTIPYLIPMLEKAGANVFVPRERDIQTNEVVVDNDTKGKENKKYYTETVKEKKLKWAASEKPGFAYGNPPYPENFNPFLHGTSRFVAADSVASAEASWIPDVPEEGNYAVYVSYEGSKDNAQDALYSVYHSGIRTDFTVNQKIGGGTWIYLGNFKFEKGFNPKTNKVTLVNQTLDKTAKFVSADAVRFGGGMGIISRNGKTSGRPKYLEGSRYWLQYAGMPDTLVYSLNKNKNDYNDDYQSRAEYANYLKGAPFGPNRDRNIKGLGIPIDLSMAFHTDAGITHNDTTVGTLSIYSTDASDDSKVFADGVSRMTNRDLADIIQTQIVQDLRAKDDPAWNRRQLKDAQYSEAYRPNMPSVLVELLSHQNFLDMKYVLDPRFRFDVARAMYKGMLKFLATQYNRPYTVQPLPVDHFQALLDNQGGAILKWHAIEDPLEPTAKPDHYIVYTRLEGGDFDNGQITANTQFVYSNLKPGVIYSFKIAAVNQGGESFPSEILSVCRMNNTKPAVLVVNGFDRICGPASIETPGFTGFLNSLDAGVPDKYDISYSGPQYDFNPNSEFVTNDNPGHGASHADFETKVIAGNSFDYPYVHGKAMREAGYSFSSSSNEAVWDEEVNLKNFSITDLILGKQKETPWQKAIEDSLRGRQFKTFPAKLQKAVTDYLQSGGNIFISGSYIGTDLCKNKGKEDPDVQFASKVLKFTLDADHASKNGEVETTASSKLQLPEKFSFNTELSSSMYGVEAPDAINPLGGSQTILRYGENSFPAGVAYKKACGIVLFGFPFESVLTEKERNSIMAGVLNYLSTK